MHASVQCKVGVDGSVGRSCDPWNVAPCKLITVLWPLVALGDWTPGSWRMPPCQAKMLAGARPTPCLALIFCSTCSVYHQSPRCYIGLFKHIYACKIYQGSLLQNIPHQGFYYVIIYTSVFYRGEASQEKHSIKVFTSEERWVMALTLEEKKRNTCISYATELVASQDLHRAQNR